MKHMVGIGCSRPFSPFSDDEVESRKGCKRCVWGRWRPELRPLNLPKLMRSWEVEATNDKSWNFVSIPVAAERHLDFGESLDGGLDWDSRYMSLPCQISVSWEPRQIDVGVTHRQVPEICYTFDIFWPHQSRKWTLHTYEMCALSKCIPAAVSGGVSFRKQRCLVKSQDCLPAICGRVPGRRDTMFNVQWSIPNFKRDEDGCSLLKPNCWILAALGSKVNRTDKCNLWSRIRIPLVALETEGSSWHALRRQ